MKDSWERKSESIHINDDMITIMMSQVFGDSRLLSAERTATGLSSGTFKIQMEGHNVPFLLRISADRANVAAKEKALADKLSGTIPIAKYIYLDTSRNLIDYDWALLEWKEGVLLRDVLKKGQEEDIISAAESVGLNLARIHSHTFDCSGSLAQDLTIDTPFEMGKNDFLAFISETLSNGAGHWLGKEASEMVMSFCTSHSSLLSKVHEPPVLVHSDFNGLNILMLESTNGFEVSAVLDWEFSFSGRRYVDIGNVLRYEHENSLFEHHFIKEYKNAGGHLNEHWVQLAKLEELIALCELLSSSTPEMPNRISDLRHLIIKTVQ